MISRNGGKSKDSARAEQVLVAMDSGTGDHHVSP